ncbi:MAG: ABC transporter substrate-binding protein, partial [Syntrophomonadaceae bacterium]|nr:ABC transporter substrate-binding protein [Syntrophomonadaceae bacterium]
MRMKKMLPLLLIAVLAMALLAGCAGGQEGTAEQSTSIKVGGSSTLAPIIAKCADDFTEEFKTWDKVDASLPEEPIVIFVSTGGSGFGLKSAVDG